ncbi:protein TIC 22-like, chloroplastic [Chenopodium quinoa]|uniref:protein TIC 22-like, chloroplastic n=1 Tax=Chenopodium quinoa TaxID=63459 RepID=UPI000B77921B|nr:protein TIC 22-like, chloroplastic [Chenopodium quinoa]
MMNSSTSSSSKHEQPPFLPISQFQQAFTTCSSFLNNFSSSFTNHLNTHLANFASTSSCSFKSPGFARIQQLEVNPINVEQLQKPRQQQYGMSNEAIEERLAGIAVYALSNSNEEFVLVSGKKSKNSLALFCLKEEDADTLLDQMRLMDPNMRRGASVVPVALNKVFQLKVNGVAFRLIPEASEVKNALKERQKAGISEEEFLGVPVFQSRSLILSSDKRKYRPVFFRKEDLENSLLKASTLQGRLNPTYRQGDIEVAVLEDIIKGMKDDSSRKWDDVIFIPPGFDVSTDPSQGRASSAK